MPVSRLFTTDVTLYEDYKRVYSLHDKKNIYLLQEQHNLQMFKELIINQLDYGTV